MNHQDAKVPPSFHQAVYHQIESILSSPIFNRMLTLIALFKYVVKQALTGKDITGDTIADDVFNREPSFDQHSDHIVSIEADRLRWALMRYYKTAGKKDPIKIDLTTGTYVPVFKKRKIKGA